MTLMRLEVIISHFNKKLSPKELAQQIWNTMEAEAKDEKVLQPRVRMFGKEGSIIFREAK